MKAWELAWLLAKHTLRGRGGDDVYLYFDTDSSTLSVGARDEMNRRDWRLVNASWAGDADAYINLEGEAER